MQETFAFELGGQLRAEHFNPLHFSTEESFSLFDKQTWMGGTFSQKQVNLSLMLKIQNKKNKI